MQTCCGTVDQYIENTIIDLITIMYVHPVTEINELAFAYFALSPLKEDQDDQKRGEW
jgi:hypothetical protein